MSIEVRVIDGRAWKYCTCCNQFKGRRSCLFCGKPYRTPATLRHHEEVCYLNSERKCPTCKGKGVIRTYGDLPSQYSEDQCPSCEAAKGMQAWKAREVPEE